VLGKDIVKGLDKMALNPEFMQILEKMKEIHSKKSEDYSSVGYYENFTRQAEIMGWFKRDIDKAFAGLVAVKLARLATLLDKTNSPNFESIDDSFLDLTTYCGLWASYHAWTKNERNLGDFVNREIICNHDWEIDRIRNEKFCYKCKLTWLNYMHGRQQ
jgi:hypothetical protein